MGGLIRQGIELKVIEQRLSIIAKTPRMKTYPDQARRYINDAARATLVAA
jgi:hypothetical protein